MSWSPDVFIGELRPWPDTVHVVRGTTDETRRYVPEGERDQLKAENDKLREEFDRMDVWHSKELTATIAENDRLRELVRDMCKAFIHGPCYRWCEHMPEPCNGDKCQYVRRMRELEVGA